MSLQELALPTLYSQSVRTVRCSTARIRVEQSPGTTTQGRHLGHCRHSPLGQFCPLYPHHRTLARLDLSNDCFDYDHGQVPTHSGRMMNPWSMAAIEEVSIFMGLAARVRSTPKTGQSQSAGQEINFSVLRGSFSRTRLPAGDPKPPYDI